MPICLCSGVTHGPGPEPGPGPGTCGPGMRLRIRDQWPTGGREKTRAINRSKSFPAKRKSPLQLKLLRVMKASKARTGSRDLEVIIYGDSHGSLGPDLIRPQAGNLHLLGSSVVSMVLIPQGFHRAGLATEARESFPELDVFCLVEVYGKPSEGQAES